MALILVADDEKNLRLTLTDALQREGHTVLTAADGAETIDICQRLSPDLILLDLILPDVNGIQLLKRIWRAGGPPIIIMTAYGEVRSAVEAMKHHAYDYICKPFDLDELRLILHRVLEEVRTRQEVERLHGIGEGAYRCGVFVRKSEAADALWQVVKRVAASSTRIVLLSGETGTGKELVAKALHYESQRRAHPFVDVNCAAIAENLFESELFGHERGAFTDAKGAKRGLAEVSHHGTLFLDEIGEMALGLQAKFLRFLEDWKFRRVGGVHDLHVDVRVVAASNRDLKELVAKGRFREDLFYRLNAIQIAIPPLRERRADILPLAEFFLQSSNAVFGKKIRGLTPDVERRFERYDWPGNVRHLRNVVDYLVMMETEEYIHPIHLPSEITEVGVTREAPIIDVPAASLMPCSFDQAWDRPVDSVKGSSLHSLAEVERAYIGRILKEVGGNKTEAAKVLGISRQTLRTKLTHDSQYNSGSLGKTITPDAD
ncbi:MAG: sigma-54-dependent Fis family transcriptional regulator [Candidatus Methylomirabilis oxygeniifera]|uniref:Putative response regulator in two-component reguatory system, sigma54 dependent transcriptional regulator n=1 Tax=Methylomirabilis oxygeniifera TaxID=671143 RepID=D5MGE3_METO1|nr:MAG: sigma-54-dependent Fis family transcriptional regulator [Candidatus Methylomirabilis oxyfera]CBE68824.1 putative response regulator in two-component reguatory system, sigma54 dependent transcriptional regulator [Candidatus Methylomirabilis oxyfera]